MMLALQVKDQYAGSSSDAAYRLAQHVASRTTSQTSASDWSEQSNTGRSSRSSPQDGGLSTPGSDTSSIEGKPTQDLQATVITFLANIDENAPGSLRRSGAINHRNGAQQTMLHIATVMGYHRLVRRLVVIGAHLDLQDVNGYTALGLASLMGKTTCVRVLIEAGASYDRPTAFGEMPLDLAKIGEHASVEALLLSAVWSTVQENTPEFEPETSLGLDTGSEIDDDNPSSGTSDVEEVSRIVLGRKGSRRSRGKQPISITAAHRRRPSESDRSRRSSLSSTPQPTPVIGPVTPPEAPPPYDAHTHTRPRGSQAELGPWMSTLYPDALKIPGAVWDRIPQPITSFFDKNVPIPHASTSTSTASAHENQGGWVAFPVPSWEMLSRMTSPEEVKMFTQAMAAAAFNAVIQSGATTTGMAQTPRSNTGTNAVEERRVTPQGSGPGTVRKRRKSRSGEGRNEHSSDSPSSPKVKTQVVTHVKRESKTFPHLP